MFLAMLSLLWLTQLVLLFSGHVVCQPYEQWPFMQALLWPVVHAIFCFPSQ